MPLWALTWPGKGPANLAQMAQKRNQAGSLLPNAFSSDKVYSRKQTGDWQEKAARGQFGPTRNVQWRDCSAEPCFPLPEEERPSRCPVARSSSEWPWRRAYRICAPHPRAEGWDWASLMSARVSTFEVLRDRAPHGHGVSAIPIFLADPGRQHKSDTVGVTPMGATLVVAPLTT